MNYRLVAESNGKELPWEQSAKGYEHEKQKLAGRKGGDFPRGDVKATQTVDISRIQIGISGWTYAPWRGVFFPRGLRQRDELAYAARTFGSIEINGTHYSLQTPTSFRRWRDETPPGFVFSVKAHRYITHLRRLQGIEKPLANFFASGLLGLGEKLGPILWQFPPSFRYDAGLMEGFFRLLPKGYTRGGGLGKEA